MRSEAKAVGGSEGEVCFCDKMSCIEEIWPSVTLLSHWTSTRVGTAALMDSNLSTYICVFLSITLSPFMLKWRERLNRVTQSKSEPDKAGY